ncbi:MFS transporter [Oenococcus sp. UCMA 17063]|nr:MFS transporter [Oenococcus sp. UCMA 17063]
MAKNNSRILTICLYLNYFVHGIGLVVLAQNMGNLASYWRVSLAEVSYVISGVGWGRLCGYFFFSYLADKVGRKKIIFSGMLAYLVFFFALPFSLNIYLGYFLAMLAGLANSALDLGTYPSFMELGNRPWQIKNRHLDSHGDHRIAMTLAVAALLADCSQPITLEQADSVQISYPDFFQDLDQLLMNK